MTLVKARKPLFFFETSELLDFEGATFAVFHIGRNFEKVDPVSVGRFETRKARPTGGILGRRPLESGVLAEKGLSQKVDDLVFTNTGWSREQENGRNPVLASPFGNQRLQLRCMVLPDFREYRKRRERPPRVGGRVLSSGT